ncbi:MAG: hypothetical protein U0768_09545 [Anaerolineae bacterium]
MDEKRLAGDAAGAAAPVFENDAAGDDVARPDVGAREQGQEDLDAAGRGARRRGSRGQQRTAGGGAGGREGGAQQEEAGAEGEKGGREGVSFSRLSSSFRGLRDPTPFAPVSPVSC